MLSVGMIFDVLIVFFFKQKTAYEMRISDWSSDVCSSDLAHAAIAVEKRNRPLGGIHLEPDGPAVTAAEKRSHRSEEHTSELQSLMRISYAVFCLKKKKNKKINKQNSSNKKYMKNTSY